ncbi:alpha/beta hydrolase family esterase [Streptomyces viridiviolaceus]
MRSSRDSSVRPRRWPVALALALVLPLAGCGAETDRPSSSPSASTAPVGGSATAPAADTRERLRVDGRTRQYLLHRPATGTGRPKPLVIAFHGRGADAAHLREQSRLEKTAGARGMLIAFPEGLAGGWGAGERATEQRPDPGVDVRFTEALIEHLVRTEGADPERVYVAGFSNGGSMALRMAARRPDLLAGAASVSGQLPTGDAAVNPTGATPVLIVYGADDPVRPLAGLPSPPPGPGEPILPTLSARASAQAFAAAGDAGEPVTTAEPGYDRTVWRLPGPAATVQLLVVHDAGHTWPGSAITPPDGFGRTSTAVDATATILDFFAAA